MLTDQSQRKDSAEDPRAVSRQLADYMIRDAFERAKRDAQGPLNRQARRRLADRLGVSWKRFKRVTEAMEAAGHD